MSLYLFGLAACILTLPVVAQSEQKPIPNQTADAKKRQAMEAVKKRQQRLVPRREFTLTPTKLDKLEDLPGLPSYPGKVKFLNGHTLSTDQGTCTCQCFSVEDSPDQVGNWYSNVLSSNDWKKQSGQGTSVTSTNKSGATATVSVFRMNLGKKHGSSVSITYS